MDRNGKVALAIFVAVAVSTLVVGARRRGGKSGGKKAPKPQILEVMLFSIGPIPDGNGTIHGFLVKAKDATVETLKGVVNSAITTQGVSNALIKAGFSNAKALDPLEICDDMTAVYCPPENPEGLCIIYCQHRIQNMNQDETKTPAFIPAIMEALVAAAGSA